MAPEALARTLQQVWLPASRGGADSVLPEILMSLRPKLFPILSCALAACAIASAARANDADTNHPPFVFSDVFYLQNGIDPTTLVGAPAGTLPGSVIDTPPGPDFKNVRVLELTAAFDDSGHPIFFSVNGLPTPASFLPNAAGAQALAIAEKYKVYEFPRASNPPLTVFPKRQDLVADLSGGYFSNNPLGVWQINIVRFTPAALNTPAGKAALADLAAKNGLDLDGTPIVNTKSDVLNLQSKGFVTIETPPTGFGRWFFCPVLKDPQGGEIAPDAFLTMVLQADGSHLAGEQAQYDLFHCLQSTDQPCQLSQKSSLAVRAGQPANPLALVSSGAPVLGTTWTLHVDHSTFVTDATADLLLLGATQVNLVTGASGTLLVLPFAPLTGAAGQNFPLILPVATSLIGVHVTTQGASAKAGGGFALTNAFDAEIGTH
jgi:hypothetical protein